MKKNFYYIGLFAIFLIFVLIIISLSQNVSFFDDDGYYSIIQYNYGRNLIDTLKIRTEHGGGYIGFFLSKFFCFWLPYKLNMHLQTFINSNIYLTIKSVFCFIVFFFFRQIL